MTDEIEERKKIIKSFYIIGLNESLIQKYDNNVKPPIFIQDIDIFVKDLPHNYKPLNEDEKWHLLIKEKNVWLRIKYNYNYVSPITELIMVECDYESPEYLFLEKKYIDDQYKPISVTFFKDEDRKEQNESYPIISELGLYKEYSDFYVKIPSYLNVKELLNLTTVRSRCAVLLISRKNTSLPLKDIQIIKKDNGNFNFGIVKNKSPYSFKYIPEILDQYPPDIEKNSTVSMFCFPEGLSIVEQYKLPIWFNFVLTDELGERTYGSTLVFWEEIDSEFKELFIPYYDEIDKKTKKRKYYFIQKAICVLSRFPFYHNCLLFLKQLYRIQTASKSKIPLERAICSFVNSLYIQSNREIVQFIIGEEKLNFYRIANYGELWDTKNTYLEVLFRVLSFKQIITAWQGLLLEKKLFLICSSKATLSCVAHALINLLFPFRWIHVLVPILPEKLKVFIDSPVPLIIGISFPVDLKDFPDDALILNINTNRFENYYSQIPKLKGKLQATLETKLKHLRTKYKFDNPVNADKWMDYQDEVKHSFELEGHKGVDSTEIRDAFYNVFIVMFKNYNKYIDWDILKNNNQDEEELAEKVFKKKVFLKDHSVNDENDFIALFCETSLFNQFIEPFIKIKTDGPMGFFLESIKNGKIDKKEVYLPKIIPEKIVVLPEIEIKDLNGQTFFHKEFPRKLQKNLYINVKRPQKPFKPKFVKYEDEWCYNINKLKKKEWPKYLLYLIYEIWFHFFSFVIHFYGDKESIMLMDYGLFLIEDLYNNKKITPTRNLFCKLFKSCGRNELSKFTKTILLFVSKIYKNSKYSNLFHNSYLSGLYSLTENIGANSNITIPSANSYLNITSIRTNILNEIYSDDYDSKQLIDNILFLDAKICPNCLKNKTKLHKIFPEQIFAGFNYENNKLCILCPECLAKIEPVLYYLKKSESSLKTHNFRLIPPFKLIEVINIIINQEREIFFYKKFESEKLVSFMNVYLSIIFYFQLFDLPLFVLYSPKNNDKNLINEIREEIEQNKLRKMTKKEKKRAGKSSSPDRVSRSPDRSMDNKSGVSGEITDISGKSTLSNISEFETEIWKNIKLGSKNDEILSEANNSNEKIEKSEFVSKYKEIKSVLSKLMQFFYLNTKEKLEIFLNNLQEKPENALEELQKENVKARCNNLISKNSLEGKVYENKLKENENNNTTKANYYCSVMNNMNCNLQNKIFNDEKNKNEEMANIIQNNNNNNNDLNANQSFSGIIEIKNTEQEEEKNDNNKILDIIEEEPITTDNNIQKENEKEKEKESTNKIIQQITSKSNANTNTKKVDIRNEKRIKSCEQNTYQSSLKKDNNFINVNVNEKDNENKISEFTIDSNTTNANTTHNDNEYKKRISLNEQTSININNIANENNVNNDKSEDTKKNASVVKKKKRIKIYSGNFFE